MSTEARRLFVIAYDIPDDSRRSKVAKKLETYGDRLQYSLFIVVARPGKQVRLRSELRDLCVLGEDSIAIFDLGPFDSKFLERSVDFIGAKRELTPPDVIVL